MTRDPRRDLEETAGASARLWARPRPAEQLLADGDFHEPDCPKWRDVGDPDAVCACRLPLLLDAALAEARQQPTLDVERLARALHEIGGEFDAPFDPGHPVAMHNSQAAAIAAEYRALASEPAGAAPEEE